MSEKLKIDYEKINFWANHLREIEVILFLFTISFLPLSAILSLFNWLKTGFWTFPTGMFQFIGIEFFNTGWIGFDLIINWLFSLNPWNFALVIALILLSVIFPVRKYLDGRSKALREVIYGY